jgi:hypothetical protein
MGGSTLPEHTTLQNVFLMIGCVVLSLASLNSFYQVHHQSVQLRIHVTATIHAL